MKKLSTALILLFIFTAFTACSKDVSLKVQKDEVSTAEESKKTNSTEISELDSKDEANKENTTASTETEEETSPQTETPLSNEDTNTSLVSDTTSPEPVTEYYYGFGFVNGIDINSTPILIVDEAEFYMYDEALQEAINDGRAMLKEDNTYALPNPYYIRNNYDVVTNYPISENCVYYVCMHVADHVLSKEVPDYELSSDLFEVNSEDFAKSVEYYRNLDSRLLTWFDVEDGEIVKMHQQYVP